MVRVLGALCAVLLLSGCLTNATTNRLLDSLQRLSGIPFREGVFSSRQFTPGQYVHGDALSGSFDGPDHVEVSGTFYSVSRKALGAFGAVRK